jgi:hypothetical protein
VEEGAAGHEGRKKAWVVVVLARRRRRLQMKKVMLLLLLWMVPLRLLLLPLGAAWGVMGEVLVVMVLLRRVH